MRSWSLVRRLARSNPPPSRLHSRKTELPRSKCINDFSINFFAITMLLTALRFLNRPPLLAEQINFFFLLNQLLSGSNWSQFVHWVGLLWINTLKEREKKRFNCQRKINFASSSGTMDCFDNTQFISIHRLYLPPPQQKTFHWFIGVALVVKQRQKVNNWPRIYGLHLGGIFWM